MGDAARQSGSVPAASSLIAALSSIGDSAKAPAGYRRVLSSGDLADALDARTVEGKEENDNEEEADAADEGSGSSWWQRLTIGRLISFLLLAALALCAATVVLQSRPSAAQPALPRATVSGSEESSPRYLLFHPGFAGFGNQLASLQRAVTLANLANRVLVLPPLLSGHLEYAQWSSWISRSPANATRTIRIDLQLVKQYEQTLPVFTFNFSALSSRRVLLLSDWVLRFGTDAVCWSWPQGVGNLTARLLQQQDDGSLCVGITGFRFNVISRTPLRRFWITESSVERDAELWLRSSPLGSSHFACLHYRAGDFITEKPDVFVNLSSVIPFTQTAMREAGYSPHSLFIMTNSADSADRLLVAQQGWSRLDDAGLRLQQPDALQREMRRIVLEQRICSLSSLLIGCGPSSFSQTVADLMGCSDWSGPRCRSYCGVQAEDWRLTA